MYREDSAVKREERKILNTDYEEVNNMERNYELFSLSTIDGGVIFDIKSILENSDKIERDILLEEYKYSRVICDSFIGIFDAVVRTELEGLKSISINKKCLNQIDSFDLNQLRVINKKLYIVPYNENEELLPGFRSFKFMNESLSTMVTFLNSEDPISKNFSKYNVVNTISYEVVVKESDVIGKFLEIELLDQDGEVPKSSFIISNDLFHI